MQKVEFKIQGLRFFIFKLLYVNILKYKIKQFFIRLDLNRYMKSQNVFRDSISAKLLGEIYKTNSKLDKEIWVDIGANFGLFFTLISGYQNKKIIAFEPNINLHVNHGDNFIWERYALSDQKGNFNFYINNQQTGASSLIRMHNHDTKINVDCIPFDDYELLETNPVTIIKIDVEGSEVAVLSGAKETIKRNKPIILIETDFKKIPQIKKLLPSYNLYFVSIPGLDFERSKWKRFFRLTKTILRPQPKIMEISSQKLSQGYIDNVFAIPKHLSLPSKITLKLWITT